jgi:hypothetical protein
LNEAGGCFGVRFDGGEEIKGDNPVCPSSIDCFAANAPNTTGVETDDDDVDPKGELLV